MSTQPHNASYWVKSTPVTNYPRLDRNAEFDVVVIGGGIVGLTAAYLLKKSGKKVAVLEMKELGRGVTGYTTAKISSNHELSYSTLASKHGEEAARRYGESNELAIEVIADIVDDLKIDCDFRRQPAYTYAETARDLRKVREEVELTTLLGLPVSFAQAADIPLPYPVAGAIRYANQAEFHPRKYLLALAEFIRGDGSAIYEHTHATDVTEKEICEVVTSGGRIRTPNVVMATHYPFLDRGLFFTKVHPHREYVLGVYLNGDTPPGMYMSTESPTHTIRSQSTERGEMMIVLGEKHMPGQKDERQRYAKLEEWTRQRFDVASIPYRWSTQDNWPIDELPYFGPLTPNSNIQVVTGLKGWGMTLGTLGALSVTDRITHTSNPYDSLYTTNRLNPKASARKAVLENAKVGLRFVTDHLKRGQKLPVSVLKEGEGKILNIDGERIAAYRDLKGELHGVSPICTHLYCTVKFNEAEKSWDCPCHGSRFDHTGRVIQGPATSNLPKKPVGIASNIDPMD